MLATGFIYALKSALLLSLLYLIYRMVLHQNTRFALKRITLLSILFLSLLLPAIEVKTNSEGVAQVPVINEIAAVVTNGTTDTQAPTQAISHPQSEVSHASEPISWTLSLIYTYWAGVTIALLIFLIQMVRIGYLLGVGNCRHDLDRMLVAHKSVKHPFSFWRWTFIPAQLAYDDDTWEIINAHENEHLRLWHSIDLLLISLIRALLWFTPAIYFFQKDIMENHEHQVDKNMVNRYDLRQYATALLSVSLGSRSLNLGHGFALKSGLSKRIRQLTKAPSHWFKSAFSSLVLIVTASVVFYHTSLYGQDLVEQDEFTVEIITGVSVTNRSLVPARFLRVMDRLKSQNPDKQYIFELELFFEPTESPTKKVVYFDELTKEESENVPMSNVATQIKNDQGKVDIEILKPFTGVVSELDLTIKRTTGGFVPSKKYFNFDDVHHRPDQLTTQPAMIGDIEKLYQLVTLDIALPEGLQKAELPVAFQFEVYFNDEGYPVKFMLNKDSKHDNEALYRLEGEVYRNFRKKASFFQWTPGKIENKSVKSVMKISIPTKYL